MNKRNTFRREIQNRKTVHPQVLDPCCSPALGYETPSTDTLYPLFCVGLGFYHHVLVLKLSSNINP